MPGVWSTQRGSRLRNLLPYIATTAALVLLLLSMAPIFHPPSGTAQIEKRFWHDRSRTMRTPIVSWGRGLFMLSYRQVKIPPDEDASVLRFDLKKRPPQWEYSYLPNDVGPIPWAWWVMKHSGAGPIPRYDGNTNGIGWGWRVGGRTWPVTLLSGTATLFCLRWMFSASRRRRMPNVCQSCGYDLRATPERCPECGMLGGKGRSGMES